MNKKERIIYSHFLSQGLSSKEAAKRMRTLIAKEGATHEHNHSTLCIHCDSPIYGGIRVMKSARQFIHEECYNSLCNSFLKIVVLTKPPASTDTAKGEDVMGIEPRISVTLNDKAIEFIKALMNSGTWGNSLEGVARRLIEERINQLKEPLK